MRSGRIVTAMTHFTSVSQSTWSSALAAGLLAAGMALFGAGCAANGTDAAGEDPSSEGSTEQAFKFLDGDLKLSLVSKSATAGGGLKATFKITNIGGLDSYPAHAGVLCVRRQLDTSENVAQQEWDGGFAVPVIEPDHMIQRTYACDAKPGWKTTSMTVTLTPTDATPADNKLTVVAP